MNTDADSFLMNKILSKYEYMSILEIRDHILHECYRFIFERVIEDPILNMYSVFSNILYVTNFKSLELDK